MFVRGFTDELTKLALHGAAANFLNSPSGAMFAAHVPLGGALLGGSRGHGGGKLTGAVKGMAGEITGNLLGATIGLGIAKGLEHSLMRGAHIPTWFEPALIAGGGLAVAPLMMHALTKVRG